MNSGIDAPSEEETLTAVPISKPADSARPLANPPAALNNNSAGGGVLRAAVS